MRGQRARCRGQRSLLPEVGLQTKMVKTLTTPFFPDNQVLHLCQAQLSRPLSDWITREFPAQMGGGRHTPGAKALRECEGKQKRQDWQVSLVPGADDRQLFPENKSVGREIPK